MSLHDRHIWNDGGASTCRVEIPTFGDGYRTALVEQGRQRLSVKLSKGIVELVDLAVSKKLATSRSELAEGALVDRLYLLSGEGKLGISEQQLQRKLGTELGLAGHLAKILMRVDRRLGQLEKRTGLVK